MTGEPLFSVVICTFDRAPLLAGALATLADQSLDPARFEVLVVDNNSTDGTAEVVEAAARQRPHVRYLHETRQGLAHARNRGWREARGTWVAYTDDDCRLPADWLETGRRIAEDAAPAIFGGPYRPFYLAPKPAWFRDRYGTGSLGAEARALAPGETLPGGNLFLRRDLLARLGGFDAGLGMAGRRLAYAEESALLLRVQRELPEVAMRYEPALEVEHLVRPEKMRAVWLVRHFLAKGRSVYLLQHGPGSGDPAPVPAEPGARLAERARLAGATAKTLGAFGLDLFRHGVLRDRQRHPDLRNYLFERGSAYLRTLGRLRARRELLVAAPGSPRHPRPAPGAGR